MPVEPDRSAPAPPEALAALLGAPLDRTRLICLPDYDAAACSAALVALANSQGGHLILGVTIDVDADAIRPCAARRPDELSDWVADLAAAVDPPLADAVQVHVVALYGAEVAVVSVRRSGRTPHIDPISGRIFVAGHAGVAEQVRRRTELDRLYRRGAAAEERAQRAIDGMVDRLQLASFGHYGLAVIAALVLPSAAPHEAWRSQPELLAPLEDPFVHEWGLAAAAATVRPSWLELRLERELTGVLRVTRAGCAAAAETRAVPGDKAIGSIEELTGRLSRLVESVCRLLGPAENTEILPRLLCEGLRGTRIRATIDGGGFSSPAGEDTVDLTGPSGDAGNAEYRRQLVTGFGAQLTALYGVEPAVGG